MIKRIKQISFLFIFISRFSRSAKPQNPFGLCPRLIKTFVLAGALLTSCEEKVNDWEVQPEYDRLFRPLVFEVVTSSATSVELKYTRVISANKYIFEFSEDSLLFNNIVKTVEVLSDTLTPFSESSTLTKTEYRTMFEDLNGTTGYSVRLQAIDTISGLSSEQVYLYFKTSAEQIFTGSVSFTDKIQISWTRTDRVTSITVRNAETNNLVVDRALTTDEIANATAILDGLNPGTSYFVQIYNGTNMRGERIVKTFGLAGGVIVEVQPSDAVADLIASAVSAGNTSLILAFTGEETYNIGSLTIPAGVTNLSFTGMLNSEGNKPLINMAEVRLTDLSFGKLMFENIQINGDYGKYFFSSGTDNVEVEEISFNTCELANFRSIVRFSNNVSRVEKVSFNDCIINNIGGYGVVNIGGSKVSLALLSFESSTLTELATQLMDVRTSVSQILIVQCTFCNLHTAMTQLLRFDTGNLPNAVTTSNNIIAGNNSGAKINSLSFDMTTTGLNVSFGGSYITNDLVINKYGFADITLFNRTTYDLFVDPDNKDFTVKPDSGFGGRGTAGDPRWFD